MKNNKLIGLFQTFSSSDFFLFRKFLCSPFFNENEELINLFDHLKTIGFQKEETEKKDHKLGIWKAIFPKKKYDDIRLRRMFSDLLQLAFDYLAHQQFRVNPAAKKVFLLRSLSHSKLEKHFAGAVRQTQKELAKTGLTDADFHYLSYMLERRQHEWQENVPRKSVDFKYLEKADHHLDCYYLSRKLEHYSDTLNYQDLFESSAQINLPPQFFEYLKRPDFQNELVVRAWHLVVLMNENPEAEDYFLHLKNLVEEQGRKLDKNTLKSLLIHLMNYCIFTKIHKNRPDYNGELLSLYKTALDKEIIIENGELPLAHYKNIIAISVHLKDFEWVEEFIQTYTSFLPPADRENAVYYNLAKVYFQQKKHEAVIEQLRSVEYQNVEYAIGSRLMLLQTYFELEEVTPLDSLLDSFKIYLRRSQHITKDTKQRCLNVIRFTKKLTQLAPYDKVKREKLHEQISNCKNVGLKPWLLEKCLPNKNP